MIYYEAVFNYNLKEEDEQDALRKKVSERIKNINEINNSRIREGTMAVIYSWEGGNVRTVMSFEMDNDDHAETVKKLKEDIGKFPEFEEIKPLTVKEITTARMKDALGEGESADLIPFSFKSVIRARAWEYLESDDYTVTEETVDPMVLTEEEAELHMDELMADKSLRDEIERIYDKDNPEVFYGFPAHYRLKAENIASAMDIARLMIRSLYTRKRITGTRLTTITELEGFGGWRSEKLLKNARGTSVLIEISTAEEDGTFVTAGERSARDLARMIEKYHDDTLFFLFEKDKNNNFGRDVISRLESGPELIELKEGRGDEAEARAYMERLAKKSRFATLFDEDAFKKYLKKKKCYHPSEVEEAFAEWSRNCLKEKAYRSYSHLKRSRRKKKGKVKKEAYLQLQDMAGLKEVKEVVDEVLAFYRLQKMREKHHIDNKTISRHMVFTGNPGCAKTTVARLLSEILLEEGIITTGAFVECGRGDLVGRYVGWTAKEVKAKFKKAEGGILFIDEAYALVDESKSFGDEAINTIVQEMENHRDDVTVIFAGYPDPMKEFLNKNEGLKSRIAFHIDFPDYDADELMEIMSLMLKEKGYQADGDAIEKCREIFVRAIKEDNFGNGRYARNLVEKAILRQAKRLSGKGARENPSKESLMRLKAEDFEEEFIQGCEENRRNPIGFTA
ncbi:MAG: AAA family ATPase [Lachnospiraceae bacterium]|nr:AAA family ATPase [Lachnospiraceae bacterium]